MSGQQSMGVRSKDEEWSRCDDMQLRAWMTPEPKGRSHGQREEAVEQGVSREARLYAIDDDDERLMEWRQRASATYEGTVQR